MQQAQYKNKLQSNKQLLLLYNILNTFQQSCWAKIFRFQLSPIFTTFYYNHSFAPILILYLDDIIYLLLLAIIQTIFGLFTTGTSSYIIAFRQSLALFFIFSVIVMVVNHWLKWLSMALICLGYPSLLTLTMMGVINLMPVDQSAQLISYIGYLSLGLIFVLTLIIYPVKRLIKNQIGAFYSYLYGLSLTIILYLWPLNSLLSQMSSKGTIDSEFVTSNIVLLVAFLVTIVTALYIFIHNYLFAPQAQQIKMLLSQDFTNGQLVRALEQTEDTDNQYWAYRYFNVYVRSISFIIYLFTIAIQTYFLIQLINDTSKTLKIVSFMAYPLLFLIVGVMIVNLPYTKTITFPIIAILSLASAVASFFYYSTSTYFYQYASLSISGPFACIFWCTIKSINKKSPVFKINSIIGLYIFIFLPTFALSVNEFSFFTSNESTSTMIRIGLQSIIGLSLLITVVIFIVMEVRRYMKNDEQNKQNKARVPVDYTYLDQTNSVYVYYTVNKNYNIGYLATLDIRYISHIVVMAFFIVGELMSIHAVNLFNTTYLNTTFYSQSIKYIINALFVIVLLFYLYTHFYLTATDSSVSYIFGIISSGLGLAGIILGFVENNVTFKLIGGFNIVLLVFVIGLQYIRRVAQQQKIFGFVSAIVVISLWLFLFFPFLVLIPFVSIFIDQNNFGQYLFICVLGSTILLILLVGVLTLIFNKILGKFQQQRKFKYIMQDVASLFREEGVEASDQSLHILYESFMFRDKKYVYFLKKGFPLNLLQDPQDQITKLVDSQVYKLKRIPTKKQEIQQIKSKSCLWSCLTCCCGQDEDQIQTKLTKAKKFMDKEQLKSLLPVKYNKNLIENKQIINFKKQKKNTNIKINSSKSLILNNLHKGPRYLSDQYNLLKSLPVKDKIVQIWHNIFQFVSNADEGEPLIILQDFKSFMSLFNLNLSIKQIQNIFNSCANKNWKQSNALDIKDFSIAMENVCINIQEDNYENQSIDKLLINIIYYHLLQYQEFKNLIIQKSNKKTNKQQIKQSPFQKSFQLHHDHLDNKKIAQSQKVIRLKKQLQKKQVQKNVQIKYRQVKQQKIKLNQSCKKWIFQKVKSCQKCCKKQQPKIDFDRKLSVRPWSLIAIDSVKIMDRKQIEWQSQSQLKQHPFRPVFNNILMAIFKLLDLYVYVSISLFSSKIGWIDGQTQQKLYLNFSLQTYLAVGVAVISVPLGIKGVMLIFQDRLGLTQTRLPASFPHPMFIFTITYKLLILSLFGMLTKTFLVTFDCNWNGSGPYMLNADSTIECFSSSHMPYIYASLLSLVIYYPLSSYAMPNFQFAQKSLDLKYRPSYLIIYFQVNFILLAGSVLLSNSNSSQTLFLIYNLINVIVLCFLALNVYLLKPCMIGWFNLVQLYVIGVGIVVNTLGIILYYYKIWFICVISAGGISILGLVILVIYVKVKYFSYNKIQIQADQQNVKQLQLMWQAKQQKQKRIIVLEQQRQKRIVNNKFNNLGQNNSQFTNHHDFQ